MSPTIAELESEVAQLQAVIAEMKNLTFLGNATTGMLLAELTARIEVDYHNGGGGLGYSTTKGRPEAVS